MPNPRIILEDEDFPIKPADIDTSHGLMDSFGNVETEVSASYIVRMMQERGDWTPFTHEEIEAFYSRSGRNRGFTFNHLMGEFAVHRAGGTYYDSLNVVVVANEGNLYVTDDFVVRCYRSRPVPRKKQVPVLSS